MVVVMSVHLQILVSDLDRSGPVPLYYQIKQWLTNVLAGESANRLRARSCLTSSRSVNSSASAGESFARR